jgi:hypothetical protein
VSWLIQSHPQPGSASAEPVKINPDTRGLPLRLQRGAQRTARPLGHFDDRLGPRGVSQDAPPHA